MSAGALAEVDLDSGVADLSGGERRRVALAAILSRYRIVLERNARIDYSVQPTMRPRNRLRVMLDPEPVDPARDAGAASQVSGSLLNLVKLPQA